MRTAPMRSRQGHEPSPSRSHTRDELALDTRDEPALDTRETPVQEGDPDMTAQRPQSSRVTRRAWLRGAPALAGAALGAPALNGFPAVGAAEPVTLRYLGTAVNQSKEIAQKVKADLGITIEYIPVTTDDVSKRIITQPNSFDIADTEYFSLRKLIPSGNLVGMDAKRIKYAEQITPVFTRGEVAGKKIGDQGTAPRKVFYLEGPISTKFSSSPTQ